MSSLFHAFTGCDLTSSMFGVEKKTAWAAWKQYPEVTATMMELIENLDLLAINTIHMECLEKLTSQVKSKVVYCTNSISYNYTY